MSFWYAITSDGLDFPVGELPSREKAIAVANVRAKHSLKRGRVIRVYHLKEGTMRRRRTGRDAYRRPGLLCRVCGKSHFLTSSSLKEHIALNHVRGGVGMSKRKYKSKGRSYRKKGLRTEYNRAKYAGKKSKGRKSKSKRALPYRWTVPADYAPRGKRPSKSPRGWKKPSRKDAREYKKRGGERLFEQWRTPSGYKSRKKSKGRKYGKDRTLGSGNWSQPKVRKTRKSKRGLYEQWRTP